MHHSGVGRYRLSSVMETVQAACSVLLMCHLCSATYAHVQYCRCVKALTVELKLLQLLDHVIDLQVCAIFI